MIRIYLYPPYSTLAGRRDLELPAGPTLTVGGVLQRLVEEHPALSGHVEAGQALYIANGRMVGVDCTLEDGDELSLIPLAAGG